MDLEAAQLRLSPASQKDFIGKGCKVDDLPPLQSGLALAECEERLEQAFLI